MDYKRVLKLHFDNGFSGRTIAKNTGDGQRTAINDFLKRFKECDELNWPLSEEVTNEYIEALLYKKRGNIENDEFYRVFNEEEVHRKLAKKGETLLHLWKLYNAEGEVDGKRPLSYRQFCRRYANWLGNKNVTFHIQRYPGVNTELDFAGKTLWLHESRDPEAMAKVTIFVALKYFGGVTQTVTPDNCKVAVAKNKDWIDPSLNPEFQAWAAHNGTVVLPAKVRSPRCYL